MTTHESPEQVLSAINRAQRRTRRLRDGNWFNLGTVGAALALTGAVNGLAGDRWGFAALLASLAIAYTAIARRDRSVRDKFALGGSVPLRPFLLSGAIAVGDLAFGLALDSRAAIVACSFWTALGCLVFAVWLRDWFTLAMAAMALVAGSVAVVLDGRSSQATTLIYGVGFLAVAVTSWVQLGRRTR